MDPFTLGRPGILQEQETSAQEAFSDVPNQISNGGPQQSQPAPHSSQISAKKKDLDTDDHNPCRKRISAERYCKSLDMIKNPSLSISEITQSHAATAEVPRTPVASSDWMTEVEIATDSASASTAGCQRSNLASHPESIMDIASSIADVEIDKRHTLNFHDVVSVPAIEMFWASSKRRLRLFSISGILLSNISSKTVFWSCPSWRDFST